MKLTEFGEAVRILRMQHGLSLKQMAESMGISSSYLSSIEFGEKRLSQKLSSSAISFLTAFVTSDEIEKVRISAERSRTVLNTESLNPDSRSLVAAFARRLQEGGAPTPEILEWLEKHK